MNYIKKLEQETRDKGAEICAYSATLTDLREYLLSPKFHEDTTVQVSDVLRRLDEGLHHYRTLLEVDG